VTLVTSSRLHEVLVPRKPIYRLVPIGPMTLANAPAIARTAPAADGVLARGDSGFTLVEVTMAGDPPAAPGRNRPGNRPLGRWPQATSREPRAAGAPISE
jgi:hypothetical protein